MRILFVCTDAELGGAERFLATLGSARQSGDTAGLVVLMRPGAMSPQLERAFDTVTYLNFPPTSRNLIGMVRALRRVVGRFQPDVISSHLFHADLVTALLPSRVPKTSTVHTQGFGPADHPLTKAIARVVGLLSFRFRAIIPASTSPAMANFVRSLKMRNVVPAIPNGAAIPATPAESTQSTAFLSLARNHPVKGHRELFAAFRAISADCPDWVLDAYGTDVTLDSDSMAAAVDAAEARDLVESGRIRLNGPTSSPETTLMAAAALVISSTYGEAFPIIGAEAAGAGVPVISTDVGSCAEFVDDPTFLVAPGDSAALAEAMRRFVGLSREARAELAVIARTRAEAHYSPRSVYSAYRSVFSTLTGAEAARG